MTRSEFKVGAVPCVTFQEMPAGESWHEVWRRREKRKRRVLDALVFTLAGLGLVLVAFLAGLLFTGCGGQAQSAPAEQTAEAPLHEDRWCCTRNNAPYGQPAYIECGLPGVSIPEDAVDCTCDSYLADCTGE